jgi:transposase
MSTVIIAVDLAKTVFEIAGANASGTVIERRRLSRTQFERFWNERPCTRVVMEACATAHFWARRLVARGFEVVLLPPQYVRPYVLRDKTDRADCDGLLQAARNPRIHPVTIKSERQQAIAALHRVRSQWMGTRTQRINGMRGLLQEFGVSSARGAQRFMRELSALLEARAGEIPVHLRQLVQEIAEEVRLLEKRIAAVEDQLEQLVQAEPLLRALLKIPGIGVLTATALYAAVGNIHAFKSGRHLASWLGLTPREHSSGGRRRLGGISKRGDVYLRTLLVHGARSALLAAEVRRKSGKQLTHLQAWALERTRTKSTNQAAVALANKLARIVWAVWKHERSFDGNYAEQLKAAA